MITLHSTSVISTAVVAAIIFSTTFHVVLAQAPSLFVFSPPGPLTPLISSPSMATNDCLTPLRNMSDCLSYVQKPPAATVPDKNCCPELAGLVESNPICLCLLLSNTSFAESYGVEIDVNRALKLPSVCKILTPPLSTCSAVGYPVPGPMASAIPEFLSPLLLPTSEPMSPTSEPMSPMSSAVGYPVPGPMASAIPESPSPLLLPTSEPISPTSEPMSSEIQVFPEESKSNSKTKFIVAAAVVVLFFVVLFLGILWWKIRLRGKKLREQEELGLDLQIGKFTSTQLKAATNNFDQANKIGEGGFGPVYKGILSDGKIVAIKQLSSKSKQGNREFVTELGMIFGLIHPNLVKLYGCCVDGSQLSLVYEYMENNSLARALFGDGKLHLDWSTRHKICVGIARGLAYLHEESTIKIVHRDIKPTNVLLDKDLNPKISDFGLAKLDEEENTHISTRIAGTRGYMAPEYALWGYLTYKADVYSFGVVLMEIVTGVNYAKHEFKPEDNFISIFDWAVDLQKNGNVMKLVDPRLEFKFDEEQVKRAIEIALLCTNQSPAIRPTMSSVVSMLEGRAEVDASVIEANSDLFITGLEIDENAENSKTKMVLSYASSFPKMHSETEVDDASKIEANSNVFIPGPNSEPADDQIMIRTD